MSNIQLLLDRLDKVQTGRAGDYKGRWKACCPAHDDSNPSLAIAEKHDGRILLKCWAGCGAFDVIDALGLDHAVLFPEPPESPFLKPDPGVPARTKPQRDVYSESLANIAKNKALRGEQLTPEEQRKALAAFMKARKQTA